MELGHEDPIEEMKTELELFLEKESRMRRCWRISGSIKINWMSLCRMLTGQDENRAAEFRTSNPKSRNCVFRLQSVRNSKMVSVMVKSCWPGTFESLQSKPRRCRVSRSQLREDIETGGQNPALETHQLAAIEEYKLQSERKSYLQEQADGDLNRALEQLKNAMEK